MNKLKKEIYTLLLGFITFIIGILLKLNAREIAWPQHINFFVSPVIDTRGITKENWFLNDESIKIVMRETSKIEDYFEDKISKWVS